MKEVFGQCLLYLKETLKFVDPPFKYQVALILQLLGSFSVGNLVEKGCFLNISSFLSAFPYWIFIVRANLSFSTSSFK